jgi:hypothetical protein
MLTMKTVLEREYGVHYNPEQKERKDWHWRDSRDSLVHGILGPKRSGTCSSLPVILVAIGRRLGYPLYLVEVPEHVLCRWDGTSHANPAWRERRNIEYTDKGMNSHPDEYYHHWPVEWSAQMHKQESTRPKPYWLRNLHPHEEMASFLMQRSHTLLDNGQFDEAYGNCLAAIRFNREDLEAYGPALRKIHLKKLDHVLRPWGLDSYTYCEMLRLQVIGYKVEFPWQATGEDALRPGVPAGTPRPPSSGPPSPIADPLAAAAAAVNARMQDIGLGHLTCYNPAALDAAVDPSRRPIYVF